MQTFKQVRIEDSPSSKTFLMLSEFFTGPAIFKVKEINVMTTSSMPAIMELVSVGYGAAFIFESHLTHHHFTHPIDCYSFGEPKTLSDFVVAYRHGSYLPSYAHDFIKVARKLFQNTLK